MLTFCEIMSSLDTFLVDGEAIVSACKWLCERRESGKLEDLGVFFGRESLIAFLTLILVRIMIPF